MQHDLNGRTALVAGCAGGIGHSIAVGLAKAGAAVVIADSDPVPQRLSADVERMGGHKALLLPLNVKNGESVKHCVQSAIDHCSRIDILVNCIRPFHRPSLEHDDEDEHFNRCLTTNLIGVWRMSRALVPHFRARGGGKIINVASTSGRQGMNVDFAYSAANAGAINLTQSLAGLLGVDNINVNTVCPGPIVMREGFPAWTEKAGTPGIRAPSLPDPLIEEDIANAVVFFASDYAMNITGQALNVDCGQLMN